MMTAFVRLLQKDKMYRIALPTKTLLFKGRHCSDAMGPSIKFSGRETRTEPCTTYCHITRKGINSDDSMLAHSRLQNSKSTNGPYLQNK